MRHLAYLHAFISLHSDLLIPPTMEACRRLPQVKVVFQHPPIINSHDWEGRPVADFWEKTTPVFSNPQLWADRCPLSLSGKEPKKKPPVSFGFFGLTSARFLFPKKKKRKEPKTGGGGENRTIGFFKAFKARRTTRA